MPIRDNHEPTHCKVDKVLCCLNSTVCPEGSDTFYIASLLYKMGHYFLDILYLEHVARVWNETVKFFFLHIVAVV